MKKLILIVLALLFFAVPAQAVNKYVVALGGNWSAAGTWDNTSSAGGGGDGKPGATDDVILDLGSGSCIVDEATAALGSMTMTGYIATLTIASATTDVDVNGAVILDGTIALGAATGDIYCAGAFTKTTSMTVLPAGLTVILDGTGNVTCNSVAGGALVVNTAGTHTATADSAGNGYWESFTLTTGTYVDSARPHTIAGSIVNTAGTLTSTGAWTMTATGNLLNNASTSRFASLTIGTGATFTATMTGNVYTAKAALAADATLTGNVILYLFQPTANNYLDMLGTVAGGADVSIYTTGNYSNAGTIKANVLSMEAYGNRTMTYSGVIKADSTAIKGVYSGASNHFFFVLAGSGSSLGAVTLGQGGSVDRHGDMDLGNGTYTIAIASVTSGAVDLTNSIDFGDVVIALSGTLSGTDITCFGETNSSGSHAIIHGGTVSNVSMPLDDAALDCTDDVYDGGGNVNCWMPGVTGVHGMIGASSGSPPSPYARGIYTAANGYVDLETTTKVSQGTARTNHYSWASTTTCVFAAVDYRTDFPVNTVVQNATDGTWHRITASVLADAGSGSAIDTVVTVTPAATTQFDGLSVEAFKGQLQLLSEDAFAMCAWWLPKIASSGYDVYINNEISSVEGLRYVRNNAAGAYKVTFYGSSAMSANHTGYVDGLRHSWTIVADNQDTGGAGDAFSWIDKVNPQTDTDYAGLYAAHPEFIRLGARAYDALAGTTDTFGPFCLLDLSSAGTVDTAMREGIRDAWHDADMNFETFCTDLAALLTGGETIVATYWKLTELRPGTASTANNIIKRYSRTITATSSGTESLDATDGDTTNCTGVWLK